MIELLHHVPDPNIHDLHTGMTALHHAAEQGDFDLFLIVAADPRIIDSKAYNGKTAYWMAYTSLVEQSGGVLDPKGEAILRRFQDALLYTTDVKMFHDAISSGDTGSVEGFLVKVADPNIRDPHTGMTAIHIAAKCGEFGLFEMLVKDKRIIDCEANNRKTAYHMARELLVQRSHRVLDTEVEAFLGRIRDALCTVDDQEFLKAVKSGATDPEALDRMRVLLAKAAHPNIRDLHTGQTALHHAALVCDVELGKLLEDDLRIDDLEDYRGERAYDIALRIGRRGQGQTTSRNDVIRLLMSQRQEMLALCLRIRDRPALADSLTWVQEAEPKHLVDCVQRCRTEIHSMQPLTSDELAGLESRLKGTVHALRSFQGHIIMAEDYLHRLPALMLEGKRPWVLVATCLMFAHNSKRDWLPELDVRAKITNSTRDGQHNL